MSPPSLISQSGLGSSSLTAGLPQGFPQGLPQGLQGNLHQGLSPYHPLNSLILAAHLHPQYSSLLSFTMTQAALNKTQQEGHIEKDNTEDAPQDDVDDDDREPGELVIKEETKEEEEETDHQQDENKLEERDEILNSSEKEGMSTLKKMLESVNTSVTKHKFEETVSSASQGSVLNSAAIADDLSCRLCGSTFRNRNEAFLHACRQCPRLPDVTTVTERYEGHLIEGLVARLHELAGSQKPQQQHQQRQQLQHLPQSQYVHSRSVMNRDEERDTDSGHIVDDEETTSDGKKVRVRSHIREEQLVVLRAHYAINPRPKKEELLTIAEKIGFPVRVVQVWFQNARARDRREGRSITPTPSTYSQASYTSSYSNPSHTTSSYTPTSYAPTSYAPPTSQANTKALSISPYYPSLLTAPGLVYPLQNGRTSPTPADGADGNDDDQPLDLSTKKSSPSASPKPASIYSDSDADSTSLAISYKSESRTPTPNSLNNNIAEPKESSGLTVASLPTVISEQHCKLAQILHGTKLGLPALYPDHMDPGEKRPRVG